LQTQHLAEARRLRGRQEGIGNDITTTDAKSTTEEIQAGLTSLANNAQNIGQIISGTIGNAFSSITDSLTQLILGTETWRRALLNIGINVLGSIVRGLIDMAVQEVVIANVRKMIRTQAIGNGGGGPNIAFFNTRQDAEQWLHSQKGRRVMMDWMRQQSYNL